MAHRALDPNLILRAAPRRKDAKALSARKLLMVRQARIDANKRHWGATKLAKRFGVSVSAINRAARGYGRSWNGQW